jgi:hypothetical protein
MSPNGGTETSSRRSAGGLSNVLGWDSMNRLKLTVLLLALAQMGCGRPAGSPEPLPEPDADTESATARALEELAARYEELTGLIDSGSGEAVDRVQEDIENLGDWEYRIVMLAQGSSESMEAELNALGDERWEVYWVEPLGGGIRVYLKRPSISYVSRIPLATLIRLIAGGAQ